MFSCDERIQPLAIPRLFATDHRVSGEGHGYFIDKRNRVRMFPDRSFARGCDILVGATINFRPGRAFPANDQLLSNFGH
jgi:hypothetical protein